MGFEGLWIGGLPLLAEPPEDIEMFEMSELAHGGSALNSEDFPPVSFATVAGNATIFLGVLCALAFGRSDIIESRGLITSDELAC